MPGCIEELSIMTANVLHRMAFLTYVERKKTSWLVVHATETRTRFDLHTRLCRVSSSTVDGRCGRNKRNVM